GPALRSRPHHRDRLGRHDGRRRRGAPGGLEALFPSRPPRDRLDQLADAVHDEGDLRAVPAAPPRPGDRHRDRRLLLLQPGPGNGPRRFPHPAPPPLTKRRPGKTHQTLGRPLPAASGRAPGYRGGVRAVLSIGIPPTCPLSFLVEETDAETRTRPTSGA